MVALLLMNYYFTNWDWNPKSRNAVKGAFSDIFSSLAVYDASELLLEARSVPINR